MRRNLNRKIKKMVICGIVSMTPIIFNVNVANADSGLENELSTLINKYNGQDIIVENGISLRKNETLDLSMYSGWEMSNEETVDINKKGIVTPESEGTVFLSNEINGKVHIIEIYVSDGSVVRSTLSETKNLDRDYYKVFIDAGHGGTDPGNVSYGYDEKKLNLQIAKLVETKLNAKNIKIEVMMSRSTDKYLTLKDRAIMANEYGSDVFVSIHNNAYTSSSANGIETFYHTNKATHKPLASEIQTNAIKESGAKNRGVKDANYAVLRETNMTSALFEGGFMTNQAELNKLTDPSYQNKLATAIANGIEKYLVENIKLNPTKPEELPVISTAEVTASALNVRSGYGENYSKIGSLPKGTKVEIVATKNEWHKIKFNGGYGHVSGSYVKILNDNETPELIPPIVPSTKTITSDIYKYDAGKGNYLTYINGNGYSQYSYLNRSGNYAFIPSSWLKAVGLNVKMPTTENGYIMQITNPYVKMVKEAEDILNKAKLGRIYPEEIKKELNIIKSSVDQGNQNTSVKSTPKRTLTTDIYKYDAGKGKYLTYINGKGYSQYTYLNTSGNYAFAPSSWIKAAGVDITIPTSSNGYMTKINNPYMNTYNNIVSQLNEYIQ
ncbi:N-acetylmuramoyl-L-alanine amidase [Romboutsia sp.]|uniref:N-acetylmuramoyl-L-alanine amidase n=1 Tax=Romboutsia sp. TaxID=1965302 RepID=UPI003F3CD074